MDRWLERVQDWRARLERELADIAAHRQSLFSALEQQLGLSTSFDGQIVVVLSAVRRRSGQFEEMAVNVCDEAVGRFDKW